MFEAVLSQLAVVGIFVEKAVQFVKTVFKYNNWAKDQQGAIDMFLAYAASVGLCYFWNVDLFSVAGIVIPGAEWAGSIVTGVVAGFGSNVLHELVALLEMYRKGPR